MSIRFTLNGQAREIEVAGAESLLTALRERLDVRGTKNACEEGECGSCSVWLDGDVVCACLVPAAQVAGREVRTIEDARPDPVIEAVRQSFIDGGAVQCGFCTPGLVIAVTDLLRRDPHPAADTVREELAGNLCRCTGYQKILEAVQLAATRLG